MTKIVEIYKQVFQVLRKNPIIMILFLVLGVLDGIALTVLFFAPIPPVSYILAPVIRTFWTEQYLHYPYNFLLLPKLFGHVHFLISTVIGVFIGGLIIKKIEADQLGQNVSTLMAAGSIFKKYFSLVIAWLLMYGVFVVSLKGLLYILPKTFLIQLSGGFILGLLVQSILTFIFPVLVLVNGGFFRSIGTALRYGLRNIGMMSVVLAIPMLLALGLSVLKLYTPTFIKFYPELVLWVLAGGIVITLIVDMFITSASTLVFLKVRNDK